MSEQFFVHRHSTKRDQQGRVCLDEHFYLNQDRYSDALSEVLHCFAFGTSLWGEGNSVHKVCGDYLSFNLFLEGDAVISYEHRKLIARPGDLLTAQFKKSFTVRTGPSGRVFKLCLLLTYTPLQSQICKMLFPDDLNLVSLPEPEQIRAVMDEIYLLVKDGGAGRRIELAQLLLRFLLELQQQLSRSDYPAALAEAVKLITTTPGARIGRAELAARCGVSISTLNRMFQRQFGCSPGQYLIRERLEQAARMLLLNRDTIKTVADECGFNSPMFFAREFKKHYGETPTEFRRRQS